MGVYGDVVVSDGLCVSCTVSKKGRLSIHSAVTCDGGSARIECVCKYFSLFAGVGFWAVPIGRFTAVIGGMLAASGFGGFFKISKTQACQKKTERSDEGLENSKAFGAKNKAVWLLYAGLTLLFAYTARRGAICTTIRDCIMQAIRWIERVRRCARACESAQPVRLQQRFLCTQRLL